MPLVGSKSRAKVGLATSIVLVASLVIHGAARAQVTALPVNKCLAKKIKSTGKSVKARAVCLSKETKLAVDDPNCPQKASDKFTGGAAPEKGPFNKADAKYPLASTPPCLTFGDQSAFELMIVTYASDLLSTTGVAAGKCDAAKIKCVGKYVAAVSTCNAKAANKIGTIDAACLTKASEKLVNGSNGCLDKAALHSDCTNGGNQSAALQGSADAFLQDVVCILSPGNAGCPTPTPSPTGTITPTPTATPDVTGPTVVFNGLPAFIGSGQNLTATGTTDPSGIASVTYLYCSGAMCTPMTLIGSSSVSPAYSVPWASQPADGTYRVVATAVDGFGNSATSSVQTVTIDNTAPGATPSSPVSSGIYSSSGTTYAATSNYSGETAWAGSVSGTASDAGSGVQTVKISLRQSSGGNYWNGTSFGSAMESFHNAVGTTSWSFSFAAPNFPAGGSYEVRVQASDAIGNTSTSGSTTFFLDYDPTHAVFVAATGNDANDGLTPATAKATIGAAVSITTNTRPLVAIAGGTYNETVSIMSGPADPAILRGGYDTSFKRGSAGSNVVTINGASGSAATGVVVSTLGAELQQLTINSGSASGSGASAYGVRVLSSSGVGIQRCSVSASAGVAGVSGTTPSGALTAGTAGANGSTGNIMSVPAGASTGGTGANAGGNGGSGQATNGSPGTNGGSGGSGGCSNCTSNSNYSGAGGGGGSAGGNGATGSHGSAGTPAYNTTYSPVSATNGNSGNNGGGGGGGGGGGRACDNMFCAGQWTGGGSGAKGGGGGQGGGGGTGGTAGGGSFAVYSYNSIVTIDANTTLTAANGQIGGAGGIGQTGAAGAAGGTGGTGHIADCCTGTPGNGGTAGAANTNGGAGGNGAAGTCCNAASGGGGGGGGGGAGGTGGTGGGGAGGPSVGMLSKGSGGITFAGNLATQVTIGTGGNGGASPGGGNAGTAGTASKNLVVP